ncbi:hypothetical protein MKX07_001500 [Trichoderma sp. CBMAI-0711]|nr:hypothetical protein MKX07_001500 [Trichoderma sp. CBMAI-0711]
MGKLQDVTRLLMAAGGSPSADGKVTHLFREKNNTLYMETWTGAELTETARVTGNVRSGTSAPLVYLDYKRIFTVDKSNKLKCFTETLRAEDEDDDDDEEEEEQAWEEEELDELDIEVHPQSCLAVSCGDDAIVVLYQKPDGALGAIEDDSLRWKAAELPACMAVPGSPLACLRAPEASYFVYVGTEGTLRYLEYGEDGWKDAAFSSAKVDATKSKLFAAKDDTSSDNPKLMVFCLAENTLSSIRRQSEAAEVLGTVHNGDFKPASDQEHGFLTQKPPVARKAVVAQKKIIPQNRRDRLRLQLFPPLNRHGHREPRSLSTLLMMIVTCRQLNRLRSWGHTTPIGLIILRRHQAGSRQVNNPLIREPQTPRHMLVLSNARPEPLTSLSKSHKNCLREIKSLLKHLPFKQPGSQLWGILGNLFRNQVVASELPASPLQTLLRRRKKKPLDLLEETPSLLFNSKPLASSRLINKVTASLMMTSMMRLNKKLPKSRLGNLSRSPLKNSPLHVMLNPVSCPRQGRRRTLFNNRPVNDKLLASQITRVTMPSSSSLLASRPNSNSLLVSQLLEGSSIPNSNARLRGSAKTLMRMLGIITDTNPSSSRRDMYRANIISTTITLHILIRELPDQLPLHIHNLTTPLQVPLIMHMLSISITHRLITFILCIPMPIRCTLMPALRTSILRLILVHMVTLARTVALLTQIISAAAPIIQNLL